MSNYQFSLIWAFSNITTTRIILNSRKLTIARLNLESAMDVKAQLQSSQVVDLPDSAKSMRSRRTVSEEQWSPLGEELRLEERRFPPMTGSF